MRDSDEVWTVKRLLDWTKPFFEKHGVETPRLDAEILLAHVLGVRRLDLYTGFDRPVVAEELARYRALVKRRSQREPVAYLLGSQGFHELELKVDRRVLIPRPETEMVVELALKKLAPSARILDVGTGSGAIALSVLYALPAATAVATDISADALAVARENARTLGLERRIEFRLGPILAPVAGERFDALLSNPPYVAEGYALEPEVGEFEPRQALYSGPKGLDVLRGILRGAGSLLAPSGMLVLEFGVGQKEELVAAAADAGFRDVTVHHDLAGIPRILEAARCML